MKFTILTALAFISFAAVASDSLNSKQLAGKYELITKNGVAAEHFCAHDLIVTVTDYIVDVGNDGYTRSQFLASQSGCASEKVDAGLTNRKNCVSFGSTKVEAKSTTALTIVGYVSESRSISLNHDKNVLTYKSTSTQIPAGILGLSDYGKFSCEYKRSASN